MPYTLYYIAEININAQYSFCSLSWIVMKEAVPILFHSVLLVLTTFLSVTKKEYHLAAFRTSDRNRALRSIKQNHFKPPHRNQNYYRSLTGDKNTVS